MDFQNMHSQVISKIDTQNHQKKILILADKRNKRERERFVYL